MSGPRYVPDHQGLAAFLASPAVGAAVLATAQDMVPVVQEAAPAVSGALRASVQAVPATVVHRGRAGTEARAGARVEMTADHAAPVEFGHLGAVAPAASATTYYQFVVPGRHVLGGLAGARTARS
ncbi:HK97 gp10 family phage protein [Actinomyces lilanjuaniae]|uniref:HK97 gp10 family phage protein n=1 Tax=Actinomyces lilanjuaniae TaxID=2321394 RepID=A0ABM6Z3A7_9ACTO|nr:HK97 gp10 family phage protein [Actinomyces lilanjuaniae]AYD89671.1 HK97 gp10 family phage protein [Actinomyces lilanjuaniae]